MKLPLSIWCSDECAEAAALHSSAASAELQRIHEGIEPAFGGAAACVCDSAVSALALR